MPVTENEWHSLGLGQGNEGSVEQLTHIHFIVAQLTFCFTDLRLSVWTVNLNAKAELLTAL